MAKIERRFFSDTAAEVAKLAFPNVRDTGGVPKTAVYNARFDGGAIATVASMVYGAASRERAEALVQYLADHVDARFADEDMDINEAHRREHAANALEDDATREYVANPTRENASRLYHMSLAESAIEKTRRVLLIRKHFQGEAA